jgi:putative transposase
VAGATWFFTLSFGRAARRHVTDRESRRPGHGVSHVQARHAFHMGAVVVLPDHLHCVWCLPDGDSNYSTRWGLINAMLSRAIEAGERRSAGRLKRGERGIWQRRFWEHCIRDDAD